MGIQHKQKICDRFCDRLSNEMETEINMFANKYQERITWYILRLATKKGYLLIVVVVSSWDIHVSNEMGKMLLLRGIIYITLRIAISLRIVKR